MSVTTAQGEGSMFGRYRLIRELGRGGMGVVYRAMSEGPQGFARSCVIKRIVPHLSDDPGFTQALVAEAKLSGLLVHPSIVQTYELGTVEGEYYLAMEFIDGLSLWQTMKACVKRGRSLPPGVCAFIAGELALALGYAHALVDERGRPLQIVHRDVSPSNVMLARSGNIKLLDFGIARAAGQLRDHETRTGTLKGKFAYMSPEQADGLPIDHRSDLFALGVLLWEALTLKRLFQGSDDLSTLRMVREAKVEATGLDAQLDGVLLKLLARDPRARWSSGEELAMALQPIAQRLDGNSFSVRRLMGELMDAPEPSASRIRDNPLPASLLAEATQNISARKTPPLRREVTPSPRALATPTPMPTPTAASGGRAASGVFRAPPGLPGADKTPPTAEGGPLNAGYEIKGSLVRAYTQQIQELGVLDEVLAGVTATTRQLMTDLPLSSLWIDAGVIEDMVGQVEAQRGLDGVRAVTRGGINTGALPVLRPVVVPLLRLFGTSPHTLLSRFNQFTKNNLRGVELKWTEEGDRAGTLRVEFPRPKTPRHAYVGFESGIWQVCGLCSTPGNIKDTDIARDGKSGVIRVTW